MMCILLAVLVLMSGAFAFFSIVLIENADYANSKISDVLDGAFIVFGLMSVLTAMVVLIWGAR